jgi:nicotinate-nucleotide pyrophosphorylase (carboxylating)
MKGDAVQSAEHVRKLIALALAEDIGPGDVTSRYFVPARAAGRGSIIAKESGVLAGVSVAAEVFRIVDSKLQVKIVRNDGASLRPGDAVLEVAGGVRSILTAERTALNFLQRLSGIATQTRRYVEALGRGRTKLLDTRKTTPGWRALEKAAVVSGGGVNHRMGLYDMVMVKDNHLLAEDRLAELQDAIDRVRRDRPGIRIELEAARLSQVEGFLTLRGVDVIMLDNMSLANMRRAVQIVRGRVQLEASGGITLRRLPAIARTGVNFISCGALTHSAKSLDLSLELEQQREI